MQTVWGLMPGRSRVQGSGDQRSQKKRNITDLSTAVGSQNDFAEDWEEPCGMHLGVVHWKEGWPGTPVCHFMRSVLSPLHFHVESKHRLRLSRALKIL